MFQTFERWLDSRSDRTLKRMFWIVWTIGIVSMILGYLNIISLKSAVAVGLINFAIGHLFCSGIYFKRYPKPGQVKQEVPFIFIACQYALILLIAYVPIKVYLLKYVF